MHAAVFVDFENLFASLKNRSELARHRLRDLGLAILEHLKARLQREDCPMVLGRSYAAFDTFPGMEVAHDLALMGFDPQYVLVSPSGRNSADVQLAVDVCRVLFRRPDIEMVVIVSGDRDFIPIARQVLEENRELRLVAIPDATSGDLRMRVGGERCWNALDLLPEAQRAGAPADPAGQPGAPPAAALTGRRLEVPHRDAEHDPRPDDPRHDDHPRHDRHHDAEPEPQSPTFAAEPVVRLPAAERGAQAARAAIVGHIPVTWRTTEDAPPDALDARLLQCLDLIVKAQIRHGSQEVWLSPFLKGPMSQHFSSLVHPERRALVNELRNRGVIRVEERANHFADHPYSVIVLEESHALVQAALERTRK